MTEEEADVYRFEKFMKQMKNYEKVKELHEKEIAESKKQQFYKDNHERIMQLLEEDTKKKEIISNNPAPVLQKKEEQIHPKLKQLTSQSFDMRRRKL